MDEKTYAEHGIGIAHHDKVPTCVQPAHTNPTPPSLSPRPAPCLGPPSPSCRGGGGWIQ